MGIGGLVAMVRLLENALFLVFLWICLNKGNLGRGFLAKPATSLTTDIEHAVGITERSYTGRSMMPFFLSGLEIKASQFTLGVGAIDIVANQHNPPTLLNLVVL